MIVLAPHDVGESRQICHDCPIAKLAIQTHHGLAHANLLGFHIGANRLEGPQQLSTVIAVASPRERSQPLMRVGLQQSGPRPEHFAPLASQIARSADLAQSALHGRQISRLGQGSLTGGLSRAIHIEDEVVRSLSVPEPAWFFRTRPVGEPPDLSERAYAEPRLWSDRAPRDRERASSGEADVAVRTGP